MKFIRLRSRDLGVDHFDSRINPDRKKRNHVRELEALATWLRRTLVGMDSAEADPTNAFGSMLR